MRVVLYHLPWSPPSVRARWALYERGIPYTSRVYVPATHHSLRIRLATGQGSVPVAFIDGRAVAGSTAIARAIDPHGTRGEPLFSGDRAEVESWVADADLFFEEARAALASTLVRDRQALLDVITPGPAWAHALGAFLWRVVGWDWARRYDLLNIEPEERKTKVIELVLALERRRAGRSYLVQDRFSYADIAVAAYLGIVRPASAFRPPPSLALRLARGARTLGPALRLA